jgi:hypothetical protein
MMPMTRLRPRPSGHSFWALRDLVLWVHVVLLLAYCVCATSEQVVAKSYPMLPPKNVAIQPQTYWKVD